MLHVRLFSTPYNSIPSRFVPFNDIDWLAMTFDQRIDRISQAWVDAGIHQYLMRYKSSDLAAEYDKWLTPSVKGDKLQGTTKVSGEHFVKVARAH